MVFIPVGVLDESAPDGNLSVRLGVCLCVCCRVGKFDLVKTAAYVGVSYIRVLGGTLG